MKLHALPLLLLPILSAVAQEPATAPAAAKGPAPIVILKLDDLTGKGAKPGEGVSARWIALAEAVETLDVKASLGIIGNALENPSPELVAWIKAKQATGRYQFWNHGFTHAEQPAIEGKRQAEFIGKDAATQRATLEQTQRLAKEKLGLTLTAFGSPFNVLDENTVKALEEVPEIVSWFYGRAAGSTKQILPRTINLENPTSKANSAKMKEDYAKQAGHAKVLVLQGHPNGWDAAQLEEFRIAVRFLKEQGCVFMTPAEYAAKK